MVDAVLFRQFGADFGVRPLHFVGQRFAHIVEQAADFRHLHIGPHFGGQHSGEQADLNGMFQHILPVAVAVLQLAHQPNQLGVNAADAYIKGSLFAGLPDGLFNIRLGPLDHILDAGRLDAAVADQPFQGQPGHFPAHRVKAGQSYDFRGVVDDELHAGHRFQSANVPSFAADETAFHLIVGQGYHRSGGFGNHIGSQTVDSQGNDAAGVILGGQLVFPLQVISAAGKLVPSLLLALFDDQLAGFLHRQAGGMFQSFNLLLFQGLGFLLGLLHRRLLIGQAGPLLIQSLVFALQLLFPLQVAAFQPRQLLPLFLNLVFAGGTQFQNLFLRFQEDFPLFRLRLGHYGIGFLFSVLDPLALNPGPVEQPAGYPRTRYPCDRQDGQESQENLHRDTFSLSVWGSGTKDKIPYTNYYNN